MASKYLWEIFDSSASSRISDYEFIIDRQEWME